MTSMGATFCPRVTQERLIYGDFMIPGAEPTVYEEIPDLNKLTVSELVHSLHLMSVMVSARSYGPERAPSNCETRKLFRASRQQRTSM